MNPRGLRNNNPFNIRRGSNWKGLAPRQTDPCFCQFESIQYGIRAGFILLRNYITGNNFSKRKYCSVDSIIRRWAPPSENNTQQYINFVATAIGQNPFSTISYDDRLTMTHLAQAMIQMECGTLIDLDIIRSAYDLTR